MKGFNHQGGLIRMEKDQEHHQVLSCAFCSKVERTEKPKSGVVYLPPSLCDKMSLEDRINMLSSLFENGVYTTFDEGSDEISEEIIDAIFDVNHAFERLGNLVF
jgi:hypothetical protein